MLNRRDFQTTALLCSLLLALTGVCGEWNTDLQPYEFYDLTLLGTFNQSGEELACFRLPNGSVKSAKIHDYVGPNHAIISSIVGNDVTISYLIPVNHGQEWAMAKFTWPLRKMPNPDLSACKR
jgi:Tfp pilus assembly protein PilP